MATTATLPMRKCPRPECGHRWIIRTAKPMRCPRCKNPLDYHKAKA